MINIPTPWTAAGRATISRRELLRGAGSAGAMGVVPSFLWGTQAPDLVLILMADLHSGYAYTAALLQAVKSVISNSQNSRVVIVVNGDIFESGNFLSSSTAVPGSIDLAMLTQFGFLAPTIVTMGNHDGDIFDPTSFVSQVASIYNVTLISDLGNVRLSGSPLYTGNATTTFSVGNKQVKVTAIGTPSLGSYVQGAARYSVPNPGPYSASLFPSFYTPADFHLALVHAGFVQDTNVLPNLTAPFLLHGAHDHLQFTQPLAGGQGLHIHAGYWSFGIATVGINFGSSGVTMRPRQITLSRTSPVDTNLANLITYSRATYLNSTNNPVLGQSSAEYDLDSAVQLACGIVAAAAGADIGFLSHTTFGEGLPKGPVTKLDLNAFVRFPGGFSTAAISGATLLQQVLPMTNQFGNFPYAQRTGDFLYSGVGRSNIDPNKTYNCVVNAFAASSAYFGNPAPVFAAADPSLELRTIVTQAIAAGKF